MMTFWILALGLCFIALAFIIVPALFIRKDLSLRSKDDRTGLNVSIYQERLVEYQSSLDLGEIDQAEYDQLEFELKKNLLQESGAGSEQTARGNGSDEPGKMPVILAVLVPVFALFAYADIGLSWGAIDDLQLAEEFRATDPHDADKMRATVEKLADRLKKQPSNLEGWYLLAQSYMNMQEYEKSAETIGVLIAQFPRDPGLSSFHAQAVYLADDRKMTPRVKAAIDKSLSIDPHDITMLEIRAMIAFDAGELQDALDYFRKAVASGADPKRATLLKGAIRRVELQLLAEGKTPNVPRVAAERPSAAGGRSLKVLVEVADSVDVGASAQVFVFARAINGPPMPLAVQKMVRGELPKLVALDESMAMMPGMGLANFDQVQVVARISSTGIANVSPDDYQALSATIDLTEENPVIKLKIANKVRDQ
jgi:cytochrome c-type biogenesis protein CcmH